MEKKYFPCNYVLLNKMAMSLLLLLSGSALFAQKDLPHPPSDVQAIAAGSFIIPMDNDYQAIVAAGQAPFNLKAYGLVNAFLQEGIPVKWIIQPGKQRDEVDLTASAARVSPSSQIAATLDFKGGPFIVPDTVLPCGKSTLQIIQSFGNNVAVYRLTSSTTAPVRYTLTHRPKIAIFNNGGNQIIHTKILKAAGISNYDVIDADQIDSLKNCYTFASEPHADVDRVSQAMVDGVRSFIMNGGNFLAQCHAIDAYENRGFFQTTQGIDIVNATVSHFYPNSDLAFAQGEGKTLENAGGSIDNWTLKTGSALKSTTYHILDDLGNDTLIATGAHLLGAEMPGGNVYYLGGHDYAKGVGGPNSLPNLTNLASVNALRLYLNAALVPSGTSDGVWANAGEPVIRLSCAGSVALGCVPSGPAGYNYLWTPATGLSCSNCPNPVAHPLVSTTYVLKVSKTCVARDTVQVIVGPRSLARFSNTTVCQGRATSFEDQSTHGMSWQWNFGDSASGSANVSGLAQPSHVFSKGGNFTVSLIVKADSSCPDTIVKQVFVAPAPALNVNSGVICQGQALVLKAHGATTYQWSTGATDSAMTVSPATTTIYVVSGKSGDCSATDSSVITVHPKPQVKFGPFKESCGPICVDFKDSSSIANGHIQQWTWSIASSSGTVFTSPLQNPSYCFNQESTYGVTLQVVSKEGCTAELTIPDLVKLNSAPQVDLGKDLQVCTEKEDSLQRVLYAGTGTGWKYLWKPAGESTSSILVTAPGQYSVTVTASNNCSITKSVNVLEVCPPRLYLGDAFSPDGDQVNDQYTVYSAHVGKFQMLIFNRWGEIIFESRDKEHHWDGVYREAPMPVGVYAWVITYEGDCEDYRGPYKLKGSVTVVR